MLGCCPISYSPGTIAREAISPVGYISRGAIFLGSIARRLFPTGGRGLLPRMRGLLPRKGAAQGAIAQGEESGWLSSGWRLPRGDWPRIVLYVYVWMWVRVCMCACVHVCMYTCVQSVHMCMCVCVRVHFDNYIVCSVVIYVFVAVVWTYAERGGLVLKYQDNAGAPHWVRLVRFPPYLSFLLQIWFFISSPDFENKRFGNVYPPTMMASSM